jgi:hypothetical protein
VISSPPFAGKIHFAEQLFPQSPFSDCASSLVDSRTA